MSWKPDFRHGKELFHLRHILSMQCYGPAPRTKLVMLVLPHDAPLVYTVLHLYALHSVSPTCPSEQVELTMKYESVLQAKWRYARLLDHHALPARRYYTTLCRAWHTTTVVNSVLHAYLHVVNYFEYCNLCVLYCTARRYFQISSSTSNHEIWDVPHRIGFLLSHALIFPFVDSYKRRTHRNTHLAIKPFRLPEGFFEHCTVLGTSAVWW